MENMLFKVGGMTCTLCSSKLENRLRKVSGIKQVKVNYATEITSVTYDKDLCSKEEIIKAVNSSGFFINDDEGKEYERYFRRLKNKIIIGFILLTPLMLSMISCWMYDLSLIIDPEYNSKFTMWLGGIRYKLALFHNWKFQIMIITPIQFIIGFQFYKNAFYSIISKAPGMDLLVSVSTLATYGYSLYIGLKSPVFNTNSYFESGGMIILFVMLGKYIEALAKKKTSNSIEELIRLQPKTVRVITENGEIEKKIKDIIIGEVAAIYPGEVVPVDGQVISGESFIDESMLTGESELIK
ncbi:MAG: HAD-IC family P-type ATPase, partial [Clostridium sp.]